MTLFAPTTHPTPSPLFCPSLPPTLIRTPQQAIQNACHRWPVLAEMVAHAAACATSLALFTHSATPQVVAWCRKAAITSQETPAYHRLTTTRTGFACTCPDWPPEHRAGPGDGQYCPHILAWLLTVYLRQPLPLLPFSACELWQTTLTALQGEMLKGAYTLWLDGTVAVPETSTPLILTIHVPNRLTQEWLAERIYPTIHRALCKQAGYRMDVAFVIGC
ncbi:MAG: DnaA N-terminal domain-containing protein [Candidatus Promineifilaceae bacterium]